MRFRTLLNGNFGGPVLLFLLVGAANYNVIFLGQTLVATSNYNPFDYRLTHLRPGEAHGNFAIGGWHDLGVAWWQWEPAGKMFSKEFRAGRFPLWDPEIGGGIDAHVALTQGQYYPPYILLLLAGDTPLLRDIYYLLEVFAAGLFCYLLLRDYGCHPISAAAMGTAYMLGGSLTQTLNSIEGQATAILPAMVWAIARVSRIATWRAAGVTGIILATAALSSFLPIVISGYLLVAIFVGVDFAWRAFRPDADEARINWRFWAKMAAAVVLSFLLIAFLIVPVQAAAHQDEVFSKWYRGSGLQHYNIKHFLTLLSPSVTYDVNQTFDFPTSHLFTTAPHAYLFYVGIIPVLLSFLGFPKTNPNLRKLHLFFLSATIFLLFKLFGMAPVQWIGYLPVFRDLHFINYFCGALNFSIAGLAGLGVEKVVRGRDARSVGIGIVASIGVFLAILRFDQTQPVNSLLQGQAVWSAIAHHGIEIARMALLAAAFLSILLLRRRSLKGVTAGALMLTLIFLDLAPLGARTRFLRSDPWAEPPDYVRFLQNDHSVFRLHATEDLALPVDVSQAFGLQMLSSRQSFNSTRWTDVLRMYFGTPIIPYPLAKSIVPNARPLLDILNVKYLLLFHPTPDDLQKVATAGLVPAYKDGLFQIFQNKTVWNRAYLANSVQVKGTPAQSLQGLGDLHPAEALLEKQPSADISSTQPAGSVEGVKYDFDRISMRVRAIRPALLVLDENYSPGWHATVEGRPVEILRANYAFQSVVVPQGTSEVQFRYTPSGFYAGLGLTFLGLMLAAGMIFEPFLESRRRERAPLLGHVRISSSAV